jgi:hypothetical protein
MRPTRRRRRLPPVVVVQRDLSILVESVRLWHLERRSSLSGRWGLDRLRRCWLGLFEGVSLWYLGVGRHNKRKSTPGSRLSSPAPALAHLGPAGRRTSALRRLVSEQPKWHNHPPYGWAP